MVKIALYFGAVSFTLEAVNLRLKYNQHLIQMTSFVNEALVFESEASVKEMEAQELTKQSLRDEEKAIQLETAAANLEERAAADAIQAESFEVQSNQMTDMAKSEETMMEDHLEKATMEDIVAKEEMSEGSEEAELALNSSIESKAEEGGVGICQFVPILDVVCDVVGGVAATTSELMAGAEAAKAASAFATAAAAKSSEEEELGVAAELQRESVAHEALSTAFGQDASKYEEKAEAEKLEAETDENAAKEVDAESLAEKEASTEDQLEAAEDEGAAAKAAQRAVMEGVRAIALLAEQTVLSLFLASFFLLRLLFGSIIPSISSVPWKTNAMSSMIRRVSGGAMILFLSILIWFMVVVTKRNFLDIRDTRDRGGTVLELALTTLCLQFLLLFLPIHVTVKYSSPCHWSEALAEVIIDLALALCWNLFMCFALSSVAEKTPHWMVFIGGSIILVGLILYHWYGPHKPQPSWKNSDGDSLLSSTQQQNASLLTEETSLLRNAKIDQRIPSSTSEGHTSKHWIKYRHALLFETLLASVLVALLWGCLCRAEVLRPCLSPAKVAFIKYLVDRKWFFIKLTIGVICLCMTTILALTCWRQSLDHFFGRKLQGVQDKVFCNLPYSSR